MSSTYLESSYYNTWKSASYVEHLKLKDILFWSISIESYRNEEGEDFLNFDDGDLEATSLLNEDELLLSDNDEGDIKL